MLWGQRWILRCTQNGFNEPLLKTVANQNAFPTVGLTFQIAQKPSAEVQLLIPFPLLLLFQVLTLYVHCKIDLFLLTFLDHWFHLEFSYWFETLSKMVYPAQILWNGKTPLQFSKDLWPRSILCREVFWSSFSFKHNAAVFISIFTGLKRKTTLRSNFFLFALAVTDLLASVSNPLQNISTLLTKDGIWYFRAALCKLIASFSNVSLIVSAWTLVLIAGDRYRWGFFMVTYLKMANKHLWIVSESRAS